MHLKHQRLGKSNVATPSPSITQCIKRLISDLFVSSIYCHTSKSTFQNITSHKLISLVKHQSEVIIKVKTESKLRWYSMSMIQDVDERFTDNSNFHVCPSSEI